MSAVICVAGLLSNLPAPEKLGLVLLSPLIAIFYWYIFLVLLLFCRYLGLFGRVLAHILIIYFFLFSRLIVQHPPKVWLPLTSDSK